MKSILDERSKQLIRQYFNIDPDSEIFSPLIDYTFKRIFTADEKHSKIALMHFLNSILEIEGNNTVVDLTVINPQIPVDVKKRKKSIFDIRIRFNDGEQAIVEMQLNKSYDFKKRSQFIISKSYTSQPIAGSNYNALKKCYLICITNFVLLENKPEFIKDYRFRDREGNDLSDDETIIFMELPKIDALLGKPVSKMTNIEMWAIFFRYVTDKSKRNILRKIINREEGIKMAVKILDEISKSEEERIQYENELIFDLDTRSNIDGAKREEKLEIAQNFLKLGISAEQISKGTGLSLEEIKKIKTNN
ncbi:MAG: Rpn family recombination-promoting nuclease/putative transposase [Sporomusaceae bacterium]|nr:Rpn family recombination-promoting nuclease/putative transposase [Sporomusaceae bacterium]